MVKAIRVTSWSSSRNSSSRSSRGFTTSPLHSGRMFLTLIEYFVIIQLPVLPVSQSLLQSNYAVLTHDFAAFWVTALCTTLIEHVLK